MSETELSSAKAEASKDAPTYTNVSKCIKELITGLSGIVDQAEALKPLGFELPDAIASCKDAMQKALDAGEKMPDAMKDKDMGLEPNWKENFDNGQKKIQEIEEKIAPVMMKLKAMICSPCCIPLFVKAPEMPKDLGPLSKCAEAAQDIVTKATSGALGEAVSDLKKGFLDKVQDAVESVTG